MWWLILLVILILVAIALFWYISTNKPLSNPDVVIMRNPVEVRSGSGKNRLSVDRNSVEMRRRPDDDRDSYRTSKRRDDALKEKLANDVRSE